MKKYLTRNKNNCIIPSFTKFWSFIEDERELISPDDKASDGHQEIAKRFLSKQFYFWVRCFIQ